MSDDQSRDAQYWAKNVDRLEVGAISAEALNLNVQGRRTVSPLQGFGQMWQKTYRVRLSGATLTPQAAIKEWKANFPSFWPEGNNFYARLTSIEPGEVAVLNISGPGGMTLSTGIVVIYADNESFTFMTPEGHMFAGWITFSAEERDGAVELQIQVLIRANDPIYEIGCRLGVVHKAEDTFWLATLSNLAHHFGVTGQPAMTTTLVDPRVQWNQVGNIWHNAAIRTTLYVITAPVRWITSPLRKGTT